MRINLNSSTDGGNHALFDPLAFDERDGAIDDLDWLEQNVKRGNALWYGQGGDGEFDCLLLIDENLDDELTKYAVPVVTDALLHVPSEVLWQIGAEYIPGTQKIEATSYDNDVSKWKFMGSRCEIPVGDYAVQVFALAWPDEKTDERLRQLTSSFDRIYDRSIQKIAPLGCIRCLCLIPIVVLVAAIGWKHYGIWSALFVFIYAYEVLNKVVAAPPTPTT